MPAQKPKVWMNTLKKQSRRPRWFKINFPGVVDIPEWEALKKKPNRSEAEKQASLAILDKSVEINDIYKKKQTDRSFYFANHDVCRVRGS